MDYITIDFETANEKLTSACSIGIVGIDNNKIAFEKYFLINPDEEFNLYNIQIHHIYPEDVVDALDFKEVWGIIKSYFENTVIFSHNDVFDLSVLKANLEKFQIDIPEIKFGCTCKMAKKLWKDVLPNFKLNTIANFLEVEHNHHNALSDALVCVEIIERGKKVMKADTAIQLYDSLGLRFGKLGGTLFYTSANKYTRSKKIKVIENPNLNDKIICISGKPSSISRNELINRLLENGVYVEKNINRSLDYFVELGNCPRLKLEIVNSLIEKGVPIKIINENEMMKLLK